MPPQAPPDFLSLASQFQCPGRFVSAQPYGFGHINDTYLVQFAENGSGRAYVFQRINQMVFRQPEILMRNIELVTAHLRDKIAAQGGDPGREAMTLISTRDGRSYHRTPSGDIWRAQLQIGGAQAYRVSSDLNLYRQAAYAFGKFQKLLADFPAEKLHETIPDFHHTPKRFAAFVQAVERDACRRAAAVKSEIDFILQREADTRRLSDLLGQGQLPLRVTHNDAKLDNVMIDDATGQGICVIDLDTVMPGLAMLDFGDAVRSGANPTVEDETDLKKVVFDLPRYRALAHGYLETAGEFLTPLERRSLAFAARLITLEQAIRFLGDHINGDVYYKIHRPDHNLDRARTQIKLVADMEAHFEEMEQIVEAG